ncbi:MAG: hypothetical protein GXY58_06565 [Planctomycetaceae bacterium]|nr:hypothetical protein [Planctomycetaceae bacterium]
MTTSSYNLQVGYSVGMAAAVGVVCALPILPVCNEVAGGGHGSLWPFYAFFAPVWLMSTMWPNLPGDMFLDLWFMILGMLGLYALYGGFIAYARARQAGVWAVLIVLGVHYVSLVWLPLGFDTIESLRSLGGTLGSLSIVYSVGLTEAFVGLQLLAFQFARSAVPYRPRMSWAAGVVLAAGLAAGVALYSWGLTCV